MMVQRSTSTSTSGEAGISEVDLEVLDETQRSISGEAIQAERMDEQARREWYNPATWFGPAAPEPDRLPPLALRPVEGPPDPSDPPPFAKGPTDPDPSDAMGVYVEQPGPAPLSASKNTWPRPDEVALNRASEATYGTPMATWMASQKITKQQNFPELIDAMEDKRNNPGGEKRPITREEEAMIYTGWVASQRSPIAALGFDPKKLVLTDTPEGKSLKYSGNYYPESDVMWADSRRRSTVVHESLHRGIARLKDDFVRTLNVENAPTKKGAKPPPKQLTQADHEMMKTLVDADEETVVRGLMLKHYGDIEILNPSASHQIEQGRLALKLRSEFFDWLENKAANLYGRKHRERHR